MSSTQYFDQSYDFEFGLISLNSSLAMLSLGAGFWVKTQHFEISPGSLASSLGILSLNLKFKVQSQKFEFHLLNINWKFSIWRKNYQINMHVTDQKPTIVQSSMKGEVNT